MFCKFKSNIFNNSKFKFYLKIFESLSKLEILCFINNKLKGIQIEHIQRTCVSIEDIKIMMVNNNGKL
jgi:hypothetical protein